MHDLSTNTANSLTVRAARAVRAARVNTAVVRAPGVAAVRPVTSPATQAVTAGAQPAAAAVEADQP